MAPESRLPFEKSRPESDLILLLSTHWILCKVNRISMSSRRFPSPLITCEALKASQDTSSSHPIQILDASWQKPNASAVSCKDTFASTHIPGARFFDLAEIAEDGPLPHMVRVIISVVI